MVAAILARQAERMRTAGEAEGDPASRIRSVWAQLTDRSARNTWHTFFEFFAVALRNPERYRVFLDHVSRDWSGPLTQRFTDEGMAPDVAAARATLLVAAGRGLIIDRLAGGDDARISGALDALVDLAEAWSAAG